jgi:hypothetical protein
VSSQLIRTKLPAATAACVLALVASFAAARPSSEPVRPNSTLTTIPGVATPAARKLDLGRAPALPALGRKASPAARVTPPVVVVLPPRTKKAARGAVSPERGPSLLPPPPGPSSPPPVMQPQELPVQPAPIPAPRPVPATPAPAPLDFDDSG